MARRTYLVLPAAACLLTCVTLALALRLSAKTKARAPLSAHAAAPNAKGLLPLSRLPASASDNQRQMAWLSESGCYAYPAIAADAAARTPNVVSGVSWSWTSPNPPVLHYGDLTYVQDCFYTPHRRVLLPIYDRPKTKEQAALTYSVPVEAGPTRHLRFSWTRTTSGLHIQTTRLPDPPPAP